MARTRPFGTIRKMKSGRYQARYSHLGKQVPADNTFATKALKKGFPRQAKLVFLMVLSDYDADSATAHKALGHEKSGTAWTPKPGFKFPKNDKPDAAAARGLRNDYKKLSEQMVRSHKD